MQTLREVNQKKNAPHGVLGAPRRWLLSRWPEEIASSLSRSAGLWDSQGRMGLLLREIHGIDIDGEADLPTA